MTTTGILLCLKNIMPGIAKPAELLSAACALAGASRSWQRFCFLAGQ